MHHLNNQNLMQAVADAKLAVAEFELELLQHYSSCAKCSTRQECDILNALCDEDDSKIPRSFEINATSFHERQQSHPNMEDSGPINSQEP